MKEFLKSMLSGESDISSKRVNGTICIMLTVLIVILSVILGWEIKPPQENLIGTIFWGGVILLGVTAVEKYMKK